MSKQIDSLLVKASRHGRDIARVTPESAGWSYVGFEALRLAKGETHEGATVGHVEVVRDRADRGSVEVAGLG